MIAVDCYQSIFKWDLNGDCMEDTMDDNQKLDDLRSYHLDNHQSIFIEANVYALFLDN